MENACILNGVVLVITLKRSRDDFTKQHENTQKVSHTNAFLLNPLKNVISYVMQCDKLFWPLASLPPLTGSAAVF